MLSQLGRHQSALEHAQTALILLQEELLTPPGTSESPSPPQADRIAVLAIAYHNIGVEQEFLKRYDQSLISYRKGVEVAERYLGAKHAICITLKNSLVSAKKAAAAGSREAKESRKSSSSLATSQNTNNYAKRSSGGKGIRRVGMQGRDALAESRYETERVADIAAELTLEDKKSSSGVFQDEEEK